jgi:alkylation response protein AidB-like acyl-CoA dehydrogenase
MHGARAAAAAARGGGAGAANLGKLGHARIVKLAAQIATDLLDAGGMLADADGEGDGRVAEALVFSASSSIYGGTNEIQRNILGERVLGLARDPQHDARR